MNQNAFSKLDLKKGLPQSTWEALDLSLKGAKDPKQWIQEMKSQNPSLAEKALEAGFSSLAALLVCDQPLYQMRALLISAQRASAKELLESLTSEVDKVFGEIIFERTQGQSQKVFEKYKDSVSYLLANLDPQVEVEARMQWAQMLYTLEKWDEVLNHYKIAFELAEKESLPGTKAICAFNLATVYENLDQKIEAKTWLWVCQKELSSYTLENLNNSVALYEIQVALKDLQDEKVIELTPEFLKKTNLSLMQRIRGLHALAESQSEFGHILDAEMTLSQSRKIIQQGQYEQYMTSQEILELNLASVIHRSGRFQNRKNWENPSLSLHYKAVHARWLFRMNDHVKALRIAGEIRKDSPQAEQFEDLFVLLSNRLEQPGKRARTLEHQIFKCWLTKQWKGLEYIKTFLEIENSSSPWKKTLFHLSSGLLSLVQIEVSKSYDELKAGLQVAKSSGLERLETLIVSLLKTLHGESLSLGYDLSPEELAFYEGLLSRVSSAPVAMSRNQNGQVTLGAEKSDLVYDEDKNEIIWQDEAISLQNQPVLQRILKMLLSKPTGLSKENLVESVWGLNYHPLHHDPMIYSAMGRLRDLIPIEMNSGVYKLPGTIRWTYLSQNKKDSFNLSSRQKKIMEIIENSQALSRKEVVETLEISERTALRELTNLVRMGLLVQSGAGRGVHYKKWTQGA